MPAIKSLVQQKHVTLGEPGVRSVNLLQYNYCVPHVAVRKLKPEVGPIRSLSQATLYWVQDPQQTFRGSPNLPGLFPETSVATHDHSAVWRLRWGC